MTGNRPLGIINDEWNRQLLRITYVFDDRNSPKSRKLVYLADRSVKLLAVKRGATNVAELLVSDFRSRRV